MPFRHLPTPLFKSAKIFPLPECPSRDSRTATTHKAASLLNVGEFDSFVNKLSYCLHYLNDNVKIDDNKIVVDFVTKDLRAFLSVLFEPSQRIFFFVIFLRICLSLILSFKVLVIGR